MATPHDRLFRAVFRGGPCATDLFELTFGGESLGDFDTDSLKFEDTSFVDKGSESRSDILLSMRPRAAGSPPLPILFLFEHKSRPGPGLPAQVFRYQCHAFLRWGRPVVAVLVHQGPGRWRGPLGLQESWKGLDPGLRKRYGRHIPDFSCKLVDLPTIDLDGPAGGLTSSPILHIMRKARPTSRR